MRFWKRKGDEPLNGPTSRWPELLAAIQSAPDDLMVVVGPEDGGSVCTDWVGAVVSISGADRRFPALVDAIEDGLFHAHCRHKLIPYRVEEGEAEALFCTKIAVAGMTQRARARSHMDPAPAESGDGGPRAHFMQWYDLARDKEKISQPETALYYCQEALQVLTQSNVFGEDQAMIERVLKGRIQTILRAHQPGAANGSPVE